MNRGISIMTAFFLSGCAGSAILMGDVAPDESAPLTLWAVPKRPCPPDRAAIAAARASLGYNHAKGSADHD